MAGIRPSMSVVDNDVSVTTWLKAMRLYYEKDEDVLLLCTMLETAREEITVLRGDRNGLQEDSNRHEVRGIDDEWNTGG